MLPVGVPVPELPKTVAVSVTGCPKVDGLGLEVSTVLVATPTIARLKPSPATIAVAAVPAGRLTGPGTLLLVVVLLPSSPAPLAPHERTDPVVVSARLNTPPAATELTAVPLERLTGTGTLLRQGDPGTQIVPFPS